MKDPRFSKLGRRERQITEIVYQLERASVSDVIARIEDPPSYSAVRAMLRILEHKGYLRHEQDGPRYIYLPVVARARAQRSHLTHLVQTLFDGSAEQAVAALLEASDTKISSDGLKRLEAMIRTARRQGR